MARRKQKLPARANRAIDHRADPFLSRLDYSDGGPDELRVDGQNENDCKSKEWNDSTLNPMSMHLVCTEIYSHVSNREGDIDVAEVNLENVTYFLPPGAEKLKDKGHNTEEHLQVRLCLSNLEKRKFGGLQLFSAKDVRVEFVRQMDGAVDSYVKKEQPSSLVILSGYLDGPDAFISGLAYLFKQGYINLIPYSSEIATSAPNDLHSCYRLRIAITDKAFEFSDGLFNSSRNVWKRSMRQVMEWLRPDLHTDEAIYGVSIHRLPAEPADGRLIHRNILGIESEEEIRVQNKQQPFFDPSALYDAVKPERTEPLLDIDLPELLPKLRPYQSRAAYWMVNREKGRTVNVCDSLNPNMISVLHDNQQNCCSRDLPRNTLKCPLSVRVDSTDRESEFYYNPFSGCVSREPFEGMPDIHGGILADEMGLGKTVELLACILANPYRDSAENSIKKNVTADVAEKRLHDTLLKRKRERVDCPCGAVEEDYSFGGFWVQCDCCDAWQHAECVGFGTESQEGEPLGLAKTIQNGTLHNGNLKIRTRKRRKKLRKNNTSLSEDHVRYVKQSYICGTCAEEIGSVEVEGLCGATLIVCPTPILRQWQEEIARHTKKGSLKVIIYEGVQRGYSTSGDVFQVSSDHYGRGKVVGAHELAAADIVLTTYDTLRADLSHDLDRSVNHQRCMRFQKRYPVVPTPLTRLRWWRVCLDEAQMVESSTARATEMALRLDAQNRWCISGTPIQRSLDDLFGLLKFLGVHPFDDFVWWEKVLKQPYEQGNVGATYFAHRYLRRLMWRSSKALVSDELGLPPQEETFTWLKFSPVEAHFYRQQHMRCAIKAHEVIAENLNLSKSRNQSENGYSDVNETASSESHKGSFGNEQLLDRPLTPTEAAKLLNPLLRLRQACCHPQVGSAGLRSLQRSPMTMDEILKVLVEKAKTEGEEAQRSLIGALNGLAALAILEQNLPIAISTYREALAFTEKNAEDFRVDPLQKLHTLHNLAEVLEMIKYRPCPKKMIGGRPTVLDSQICHAASKKQKLSGSLEDSREGDVKTCASRKSKDGSVEGSQSIIMDIGGSTQGKVDLGHTLRSFPSDPGNRSSAHQVPRTLRDGLLIEQCQDIKTKYMSSFYMKLSSARQDFRNSHDQVSESVKELEALHGITWWLDALAVAEQSSRQGNELVEKIRDSLLEKDALGLSRVGHENASSLALRFRDVNGLRYILKKELDAVESNRQTLINRLIEIDQTMDNPKAEDIERAGHCSACDFSQSGPPCIHCEMDNLFQLYENRLFLLKSSATNVGKVVSVEDAFVAQERMRIQRRMNAVRVGAGSSKSNNLLEENFGRDKRYRGPSQIARTDVSRAPSETETILKIIKTFVKQTVGRNTVMAGKKHLQALEAMRKEYAQARMLALAQRGVLFAHDELNMAITRLRIRYPGENVAGVVEELFKLCPEEIPDKNAQLTGDKFVALDELSRTKGQLRYLKGLALARKKSVDSENVDQGASYKVNATDISLQGTSESFDSKQMGGSNDVETCPVCQELLDKQMMVFPCGHLLCCKCMMTIVEGTHSLDAWTEQKRIRCPSCRYRTHIGDIAFVDNGCDESSYSQTFSKLQLSENSEKNLERLLPVKGSYGTKMEAVTRRILWIKSKDPDAKFLVFSSWNDVLDVVEHALSANNIGFVRVKGRRKLDVAIHKFKGTMCDQNTPKWNGQCQDDPVQVLLLLIQQGANGLNLVEAQHVILVEPLINPGAEAQAINRVHRFGQQHATFVHRFLIKETVEESIYKLCKYKTHSSSVVPNAGVGTNKQDFFSLTLHDVSILFAATDDGNQAENNLASRSLSDLPPAAAAAAAAEARLNQRHEGGQ